MLAVLTALLLSVTLCVTASVAGGTVGIEDVLSYEGLSTRVGGEKPGIRSLWKADKAAVAALEADGYTVAFGAVMGVAKIEGVTVTLDGTANGTPVTSRTLAVEKGENGYTANTAAAEVVTVYETGAPSYATNRYSYSTASAWGFAFTTVWTTDEYRTAEVYEGTELVYTGFVALTKNGVTEYAYSYAEGDLFGTEEATYGVATSLYEISSYFMNDYRASDEDAQSKFVDSAVIRATLATCGLTVTADGMEKNGSATLIEATDTTDKTFVVSATGSGNGITVKVDNARSGFYKVLLRATNNALTTSEVRMSVNGNRTYAPRIVQGETAASENYAVAKDDGFRDLGFFAMLDEGENTVKIYMDNGTENTPFGVAAAEFVLVEEINARDIVLAGVESLDIDKTLATGASNSEFNETATVNGVSVKTTAFIRAGYLVYNVHIPADGVYDLSALAVMANGSYKVSFEKDGVVVSEKTLSRNVQHGGSRSVQYTTLDTFELSKGDYELKIGRNGLMSMSNLVLSYREPTENGSSEKNTTFNFSAKDALAAGDTAVASTSKGLLSDGYTVYLPKNVKLQFTVDVEVAGVYLLSGKHNANNGKVQYFYMEASGQTAHKLCSRINPTKTSTAFTSVEDFAVADKTTEFTDADGLGYIYLTAGKHTLSLFHNGNGIDGLGIGNLRLSLVTEQKAGSIYVSAQDASAEFSTTEGVQKNVYDNKVMMFNGSPVGSYVTYKFTPTKTAVYDLNALWFCRNDNAINVKIYETANEANVVIDTDAKKYSDTTSVYDGGGMYSFGCSSAPVESSLVDGISLVSGTEYTIKFTINTSGGLFGFTDFRLIARPSTDVYEGFDAGFTAGAVKADGNVDETVSNAYVSAPLLVKKAGTTLRVTVQGTLSGYAGSDILTVAAQKVTAIGYVTDLASPLTTVGEGYNGAAGYMTYYVTTTADDTVLRFSVKANEKAAIALSYVGEKDAVAVAKFEEVDLSLNISDVSATFGNAAATDAKIRVSGAYDGTMIALVYDKGEYLIAVERMKKTEFSQLFDFDFNFKGTAAKVRFVYVADENDYTALAPTYEVTKDGVSEIPNEYFSVDADYLANVGGNEGAFVVYPDETTSKGENVVTLDNGTNVVSVTNAGSVYYKVDAPAEGIYKVELKANRMDGYIQQFLLRNTTVGGQWANNQHRGESRFGASGAVSTATSDTDYAVPMAEVYGDFTDDMTCYVYLKQGSNNLQVCIWLDSSALQASNKLGLHAMRFTPTSLVDGDTVVFQTPTSAQDGVTGKTDVLGANSQYNSNGWFFRGGSTVYFNITVPSDGEYEVTMLGSVWATEIELQSLNATTLPLVKYVDALNSHSTSTMSVTLGTMHLKSGTHTMKLVVPNNYFHANVFMFNRVGDYDASASFAKEQKAWGMHDDGAFELAYRVVGYAPSGAPITERVTVTGVDANGEFSYVLTYQHGADETDTTHIFTGEAREGLVSMTVTYGIYDGDTCVYEKEKTAYDAYRESLKNLTVVTIGDSYFDDPAVRPNMWIDLLGEKYDLNLYNHGYSGSTVANYTGIIQNNNSGSKGQVSALNPMVNRFDSGAPRQMPDVDADIVLFDGGRNDFSRDVPLGSVYNEDGSLSMDEATFCGAANSVIAQIREKYPNALILTFTCYYYPETNTATGHTQLEFAEAMMAVAEANGVACFNNADQEMTGVYMDKADFRSAYCKSATDFSHLNAAGMKRVFPIIETFIADNYDKAVANGTVPTTATVDSATFGTKDETEVNVTFKGANGDVYALAYDSSESLIGWTKAVKTEATQSFTFTFDTLLSKAASVRLLIVGEDYETLTRTYRVTKSGVSVIAKEDFAISEEYLSAMTAGVDGSVVLYPDEFILGANATVLPSGTVLLESGGKMTFKVVAPAEGIYKLDMKYVTAGGYIQYLRIYNRTATAWYDSNNTKSHAESRLGDSGKASTAVTDTDYMIRAFDRYSAAFDETAEMYVYLVEGGNSLSFEMTTNVAGNKIGVDAMCFSPVSLVAEDTVVMPVGAITTPVGDYTNKILGDGTGISGSGYNGWFVREGSEIYFDITVAEAGQYRLTTLGCAWNANITVKSGDGSFLPVSALHNELLTHSMSTVPFSLGVLNLVAGTHTVCVKVSSGYFHTNMFLLDKVAEYDAENTYALAKDEVTLSAEDGAFRVSYNVIGKAADGGMMTEKLVVTVTEKTTGTVTYTMTNERTSYDTKHVFERDGVAGGLVDIKLVYQLWNGDELLYEADPITYTPENKLNVIFLSDLHYAGTNADIDLYHSTKGIINQNDAIKYYASDYAQTDNYGWDSERRFQRVVDELVRLKKAGKLDLVFILGDAANNESNYDNYAPHHKNYNGNPLGASLDDFWESPANYQYWAKKMFFDQLSAAGIPYFIANGNHDYVYEPNASNTDLDYTEWERLFHTAELFGHRTDEDNGEYLRDLETDEYINYSDSDSVHYLVRVIRRNGEVKILSALSSEELLAFKAKYAGDGNYYDCYVSEDTLTESDTLLASFMMVNGFQWEDYKFYCEKHVYKDPVTGQMNYQGQTTRYSEPRFDFMDAMMEYAEEYPNVFLMGHLLENKHSLSYVQKYDNIKAVFTGDVHHEGVSHIANGVYNYVDGHNVTAFHYDTYYNADGTKDLQYFNNRGANALTNSFWSDFLRHPYNYLTLEVAGSVSTLERVKTSGFYQNGKMTVTGGSLSTAEIRYERAVADPARFNTGDILYVTVQNGESLLLTETELLSYGLTKEDLGVREVYVGCDSAEVGKTYRYMHSSYTVGKFNEIDYLLETATGKVYTRGGAYLGTATKIDANFTTEGNRVSYDGNTYYLGGAVGEIFGHYLYDEKGDWVFVDKNGNYVFVEAQVIREGYYEASIQQNFTADMYVGSYERFWYYQNSAGEFITLDADGDGILDDGTYTDLMISTSYKDWHYVGHLFAEGSGPKIVIENGKIVSGEAWARFGYVRNYMLADGTAVSESDLVVDYDANGNIVYGFYQPTFRYANATLFRG